MDQRKLKVEPAGKTEGDWWAATPSSTELPEYQPGEFKQLVAHGVEGGELPDLDLEEAEPESLASQRAEAELEEGLDELSRLENHMSRLLQAAGKPTRRQRLKKSVQSPFRGR